MKQLGKRIAALRESRNLSQEALAEQVGVSRQAISKWERDEAGAGGAKPHPGGIPARIFMNYFNPSAVRPSTLSSSLTAAPDAKREK